MESKSRSEVESESSESFPTPPKNVPTKLWEKFKLLEKRTEEATRKSTNKRKQDLKDEVLLKVKTEINDEEGVAILQKYDIKIEETSGKSESTSLQVEESDIETRESSVTNDNKSSVTNDNKWNEVRNLIDINQHLYTSCGTTYNTSLDDKIEKAIKMGDVEEAEKLSDHMTCRQFGKKVADAIEAREYLKRKKIEEESIKQKKKKKLHWGFQEKERWETKGNM